MSCLVLSKPKSMNKPYHSFTFCSQLTTDKATICQDVLTMQGVNNELLPLVKMTAPAKWQQTPISRWPTLKRLFSSWLLLFRCIPIDYHHFMLQEVREDGFREASSSLMNAVWQHERKISAQTDGRAQVEDHVRYRARLPLMGWLLKPIYQAVFRHRHRRLQKCYGGI